jgi:hypothetical protein
MLELPDSGTKIFLAFLCLFGHTIEMAVHLKPVEWLSSTKKDLLTLPEVRHCDAEERPCAY